MSKVLFVCTGNICRSPTAEGVFRHCAAAAGLGATLMADSAGTQGYHVGAPPDPRTVQAAAARGFDLRGLRARLVGRADFYDFDLILAMDSGHFDHLEALRPKDAPAALKLYLDYHPDPGQRALRDVPDPYYGARTDFERVLDLVEQTSRGLLEALRK